LFKLAFSLTADSPVRRRVVKRLTTRGFEALAREDDAVVLLLIDADYELHVIGEGFRALGFAERYHGHEGWCEFIGLWRSQWTEVRYAIELLIDRSDGLIGRVTAIARGASSGAEVRQTAGYVWHFGRGAVVSQDFYWDWSECAAAVGPDNDT